MARRVASITHTPVKGTTLLRSEVVDLSPSGIPEDRLFHVVDVATGRQIGASPRLLPVRSSLRKRTGELVVELPDGRRAEGRVQVGEPVVATVAWDRNRPVDSLEVVGPWSSLLSEHLGKAVVLAQAMTARRALDVEPVTLLSEASVRRAERELDQRLGTARFRMNLNLAGSAEHEEDEWYGRRVSIGDAELLITGPVPRCAATTYSPMTGVRDAATLKAIVRYRTPITDPGSGQVIKAPFGVYARVLKPGRIAVGDAVELG